MPETIAERARIMAETIFDILNLGDSSGATVKRVELYIQTELANADISRDEPCDCGFRDVVCAECGEPR